MILLQTKTGKDTNIIFAGLTILVLLSAGNENIVICSANEQIINNLME